MKSFLALLLVCFSLDVYAAEKPRPNILFAFADDWGRHASAYAKSDGTGGVNDVISTPNFDRVAREGVLFQNAHVTAPSCTPCRSSLLSGQYFWRTGRGAILQGAVWDESIPSYPLLLEADGYHIGKTYKVWSPGTPADAPYGGKKFAYEKAGKRFNGFSQGVSKMVAAGKSIDEAKQVLYDETQKNFGDFLAARDGDKPFCYWFGPTNVHRKWIKGSGKNLWGIDPDKLQGKMPAFLPDVPEVRQDLADYFGEIQAFDHALGLILKKLEASGELENTIVVVSGDHGAPGFTHGKCDLYDFGTAVPLAIRWPGHGKPGRVVEDFVNLTDLAPTFLDVAGSKVPEVMTGKTLTPVLESDMAGLV
ncbi:MAG: N-sulfoglucosamine sulfohydrolase, partial [Verrucomicrobiales bacterium]